MNNIIFDTQSNFSIGVGILLAIVTGLIITAVLGALAFVILRKLEQDGSDWPGRHVGELAIAIILVGPMLPLLFANNYFHDSSKDPVVYSTSSWKTNHYLTVKDFNDTMRKQYHYDFKLKNKDSKLDDRYYTVTNLKTKKQNNRCYIEFEKINNDVSKIKLKDVSCGNSIMQDIVKNK